MNVSKQVFLNAIYNYVGAIFLVAISFVVLGYLTKNLSLEEFGQYHLVLSTQVFFVLLLRLGLPSVISRFVPECIIKKDYIAARKIIVASMGIVFIFGLIVTVVMHGLSERLPHLVNRFSMAGYLSLACVLGVIRTEVRVFEATFCAFLKQRYKVFFEILGVVAKMLLFMLSIKSGIGLLGIIFSIAIVDIFLIIVYLARTEYYLHHKTVGSVNIQKYRFFRYGIKEYFSKLLSFFWDIRIDAYFITLYLGISLTGIFYFVISIATMLANYMPGTVMRPISRTIFIQQYAKHNSKKEMQYLFQLNNKLKAFFAFPVFLGFALLSDKIVSFFFDKYAGAVYLFPVVLFFMLFYMFLVPIRNVIIALEKNEITVFSSIVLLYKIPATIFLTRNFGLMGTAFAAGSTLLFYFLIQLFLLKRVIKITFPWFSFFKILVNSSVAAIVIIITKPFITNIFSLCNVICLAVFSYLLSSFFNKTFDDYDRQILNKPFKRAVWVF